GSAGRRTCNTSITRPPGRQPTPRANVQRFKAPIAAYRPEATHLVGLLRAKATSGASRPPGGAPGDTSPAQPATQSAFCPRPGAATLVQNGRRGLRLSATWRALRAEE